MRKNLVHWLTTQECPMFDICLCTVWDGTTIHDGYEVTVLSPPDCVQFAGSIQIRTADVVARIQAELPTLCGEVATLALTRAVEDLKLRPWWQSAGPMTENIRDIMRVSLKEKLNQTTIPVR